MPVSYPSNVVTVLDVPEVQNFKARFKYNFFVVDEKVNDSGDSRIHGTPSLESKKSLRKRIPRWVEFYFNSVDVRTNASVDNEFVLSITDPNKVKRLIFSNLDKIQNEVDVSNTGYSILGLQDQTIDYKTNQLLLSTLATRARSGYQQYSDDKGWEYTAAGAAKLLNKATGEAISGKWISRMIGDLETRSVFHHDTSSGNSSKYMPNWLKGFSELNSYSQINDKFIQDIILKSVSDPTSPYMNELSHKLRSLDEIQGSARQNRQPDVLSDDEYTPNIVPISINRISSGKFASAIKIIGYIIDKWELQPDKSYKECEPIIIAGSNLKSAVDAKIKYGGFYSYSIRAIALAQFQSIDEETSQIYAISGLVSSRPSQKIYVKCLENRAPPPPTDVDFVWDYRENKLSIMWSFPITSQRDIKRFQVFKRSSIYDPFELQIEYDFDDSELPSPRREYPRKSHVIALESPLTVYRDDEFTKQSVAIYSLCSIDAHDFSSNYSVQYVIWFDETKNKLMKKLLSPAGAPKPYPNFYLIEGASTSVGETNLTNDSMKDSGHSFCKVYFDPEYLSVKGKGNDDLNLWATLQTSGSYQLQFINVDRQKSQVFSIEIDDLRTKKY